MLERIVNRFLTNKLNIEVISFEQTNLKFRKGHVKSLIDSLKTIKITYLKKCQKIRQAL